MSDRQFMDVTTLGVLRQMIDCAKPSYVCELGPRKNRLPGNVTTITVDGVFYFDKDGRLLTLSEANALVDDFEIS